MSTRPETGDIRPGMEMFIRRSSNDQRGRPESDRYIPVTVTSAARVWVVVTSGTREWRIRRDTMDEGTKYSGSNALLVTPEQRAWSIRESEAWKYLDEQGLLPSLRSPWNKRLQELADLIRNATN